MTKPDTSATTAPKNKTAAAAAAAKATPFEKVFAEEYEALRQRCDDLPKPEAAGQKPTVRNGLIGVALSGGGNRSSTFCLGVLQALNAKGILKNVNYLSTVSGGGYIGTAVTIGMSQNNGFPFGQTGSDVGETRETRHLRDTSRYLVQNGIPSVISAAAIYLRGIVMNALILLPLLLLTAMVLVLLKPDTATLSRPWVWMSGLPAFISQAAMPLSMLGLLVVLACLTAYAVVVSIMRIKPIAERQLAACFFACILGLLGVVALVELHFVLLRFAFEQHDAIPKSAASPELHAQIAESSMAAATKFIAWITPLVAALLPFLKSIAAKAVSGQSGGFSDIATRWGSRLILVVAGLVVPLLLWLIALQLAYWGIAIVPCKVTDLSCTASPSWAHAPGFMNSVFSAAQTSIVRPHVPQCIRWLVGSPVAGTVAAIYLATALMVMALWLFLNVNSNSLHQLYRDRLGAAFLQYKSKDKSIMEPADGFCLSDIDARRAPYHLINAALNVPGSKFANRRGRNADFFLFSKLFVGSELTGYVSTTSAQEQNDGLNIGTAMAISGAAAAPNMGMASMRPLSPTIAFLNVRLGRWLRHPRDTEEHAKRGGLRRWWFGKPGPFFLLREAFSKSGDDIGDPATKEAVGGRFVFLTDGGHIENLGVYELLRRRCAVIVSVDGEADPDMTSGSLVQLERFARIDLGTKIVMNWRPIGARSRAVTDEVKNIKITPDHGPHVALGLIDYPPIDGKKDREKGLLIYVKSSLSGDENDYVLSYKAANPAFPHETTMDQLFTEEQFEAYRALGEHIFGRFLGNADEPLPSADFTKDELDAFMKLLTRKRPAAGAAQTA